MERAVRRKLDAAEGARAFSRSHPSDVAGHTRLVEQLDAGLGEVAQAVQTQVAAEAERRGAAEQTARIRRQLARGYLRVIVKAGQAAAREDVALAGVFAPLSPRLTNRGFVAEARSVVIKAREHAAALEPEGADPETVSAAAELIERCAAGLEGAAEARNRRVQATAMLRERCSDLMDLVERLDGFNRHRFSEDADLLTAWESARNLVSSRRRASGNGSGPAAGAGGGDALPPTGTDQGAGGTIG